MTCRRIALMSSPPIAAATTSGFVCWIFSRYEVKSRVFCGTISSSITLPPLASISTRVAFEVLMPHT
jgi:hypothetical protein